MMISLTEVQSNPKRWTDTSYIRTDGKLEYREKKKYGNRHAVFDDGALLGIVHTDKHNATDFPFGTVNHFSNYVEEKSGISQVLVNLIVAGVVAYAGYKTTEWAFNKLKDSA